MKIRRGVIRPLSEAFLYASPEAPGRFSYRLDGSERPREEYRREARRRDEGGGDHEKSAR